MKTTLGAVLVLAALLAGCSRREAGMGQGQTAGKAMDSAGAQAAAQLHAPIDKANQAAQAMADAAEQTRDKVKEATEDAPVGQDAAR